MDFNDIVEEVEFCVEVCMFLEKYLELKGVQFLCQCVFGEEFMKCVKKW